MLQIVPETQLNQYIIITQISTYARNSVFKAYIPTPGEEFNENTKCYIIKAIPFETKEEIECYNHQAEILNLFKDIPTIVQFKETFILNNQITGGKQYLFGVMDFCSYIDLFDFYSERENEEISPDQIRSIAYQSLKILDIIHKEKVVHHDIKPANFLIESISPLMIKITDFEFSVRLKSSDDLTDQPYGTCFYMAPEILNCQPHGMGVDIWALGIMLYELNAKRMPFNLREEQSQRCVIRARIKINQLSFDDSFKDPNQIDLLSKMLEKDPSNRISSAEALKHPYFNGL